MEHPDPLRRLAESLVDVGERMQEALADDDLDAFGQLLQERGAVVERLAAFERPTGADSALQDIGAMLERQSRELEETMQARKARLADELRGLEQVRQAGRRYGERPAKKGILHGNVYG